jgi:adenylate cyclase
MRNRFDIRSIARDLAGERLRGALPPRVMAAIRRQDWSSEVLIRLFQLGIVLTFGMLWLVSPRTDANTAFTLVPYALAVYLALTLFGLIWSARRELPDWAVQMSIVFDMALLMVLIWSFHVQYEQPASFYLKIPTFVYVFIFIALRVLRFEPQFVLSAGLMAAAAWLAMLAYAVLTDATSSMVTRNFVTYLTSNSILIGAEVDKILAILVVTGVLWIALRCARGLLVRAVSDRAAAENLSRFFDDAVAMQIRDADDASALSQGVRREASVLFVDMRGFTRLAAEMAPDAVMRILSDYQGRIVPLIQARGGTIDKFLGDGIMATFGAVHPNETHAADALAAVDAIMADAASWPASNGPLGALPPNAIGAAVASGPVVVGIVGDGNRLEFTVIGSPVNLAAKLEKHNKTLGCRALTTAETHVEASAQGYRPEHAIDHVTSFLEGTGQSRALAVLHR